MTHWSICSRIDTYTNMGFSNKAGMKKANQVIVLFRRHILVDVDGRVAFGLHGKRWLRRWGLGWRLVRRLVVTFIVGLNSLLRIIHFRKRREAYLRDIVSAIVENIASVIFFFEVPLIVDRQVGIVDAEMLGDLFR